MIWELEPGARAIEKWPYRSRGALISLRILRHFWTRSGGVPPPSPTPASFNHRFAVELRPKATSSIQSSGRFRCLASIS